MVFKKKMLLRLKNFSFLEEKDIAISFGRRTYFIKLKRKTQIFIFFVLLLIIFNIFYFCNRSFNDFEKNFIFEKNEQLSHHNENLEKKIDNIEKHVNLINKYLDNSAKINKNKFTDSKKKILNAIGFRYNKSSTDKIDNKLKNIYLKIENKYLDNQRKIEKLNLFPYQKKGFFDVKKKSRLYKTSGVGGPLISFDLTEIKPTAKKEKIKSFEEIVNKAIESEKFLKLIPIGKPTLADYKISSNFGYRKDPWLNKSAFHNGIDIDAEKDEIISTMDGIVTFTGEANGYGNLLEITKEIDNHKVSIRFGHIRKIFVKNGEYVEKGQVVALQGNKGRSTAKHIHYEIKYNDMYLNPKNLLNL